MIACYKCGKEIKGKAIGTWPTKLALSLGDFPKSYHPKCYEKAQDEAKKELEG